MSYTIADLRKGVEFVTHPCSPIDAITAAFVGIWATPDWRLW